MRPDNASPSPIKPVVANPKKLLVFTLLIFAALVIFVLPRYASDSSIEADSAAYTTSPTSAELTPSQIAEKKQYRQEAQAVLSDVVNLIGDLDQIGAAEWATNSYDNAKQLIEKGDKEYLGAKYQRSIETFMEALEALKEIDNRSEKTLKRALDEGFRYLEDLRVEDAAAEARLALMISRDAPRVQELYERSKLLPKLVQSISLAEKHVQSGNTAAAILSYEKALKIDSRHKPTQETLNILKQQKRENDFYAQMSIGFNALDENRFGEAQTAFRTAKDIDSSRAEAQQALEQLFDRQSQYRTDKALKTADQLEKMEEWQKAVDVYDKLIAEDVSLVEPKIRRLTASLRAQIDRQIEEILKDPLKLSSPTLFRQTQKLLEDIKGVDGGQKLKTQVEQLESALYDSQVPVEVRFGSDGLTNVTLYRIGEFGTFTSKNLGLRPGRYQVAGSRTGFRDVQIEFTVKPNSSNMSIEVRCTDPI
ncbi:MAG: hypothetical protein CMK35_00150 [Porticoccaceae bacterium]|nr:hypothetical protein [Porticoccaceae bacterium]